MKKIINSLGILLVLSLGACNVIRFGGRGDLATDHFKTAIPFKIEKNMAIVVPISIGGATYRFQFDTHAPEAAYDGGSDLAASPSLKYLGSSGIKIRTISGEKIDRAYYSADSVRLGSVLMTDVSLIQTPGSKSTAADTTYPQLDGILGISIMRHGIWKIDFEHNIITFASSIDSLTNIGDKVKFAKSSLFDIFNAEATFAGLREKTEIDFGANTYISMPLDDMKKLNNFGQAKTKTGHIKTAAGKSSVQFYTLPGEPVTINDHSYSIKVTGSQGQSIPIIGLDFFRQYKYVIIDYPGSTMYVSGTAKKM